jgi:hypothetical protein
MLRFLLGILAASLVASLAGSAAGQCILANPSFELGDAGGNVFGGWNQFGPVGETGEAYHGARAARISGPDSGGWDVAGYWQDHDGGPGEQFAVTGHVRHPASAPLSGDSVALVNVEWRDAAGELIDYDSHSVADASSATGEWLDFDFVSPPAPAGTAATRLLVAVLQGPDDAVPEVHFDQVTYFSTAAPTIDEVQWNDFPGGRTVDFGSRSWRVKGPGYYGPGPNVFSDAEDCVWVDAQERLHLTLQDRAGTWTSTEVVLEEALGYGDYVLTTVGRLDLIDPAAVLGLFLWEYGPCWDDGYTWWNAFNEIDIEYSRWGDPFDEIAQFVAQPYWYPGNIERFDASFAAGEVTSHAMRWLADRVEYRVWRGGPADEAPENLIHAWTYAGPHVPRPEQPRLHLNLWKLPDIFPGADQEMVFQDFVFVPAGGAVGVQDDVPDPAAFALSAAPNPFNPRTTVHFELPRTETVELAVYDAAGRRVRRLLRGELQAGRHRAVWDGRDDAGRTLASGVYLVRLRGPEAAASRAVTLIK